MRVSLGHSTTGYGTDRVDEYSVLVDDEIGDYNPIRTSELAQVARDTFRLVLADAAHERAEHEKPAADGGLGA